MSASRVGSKSPHTKDVGNFQAFAENCCQGRTWSGTAIDLVPFTSQRVHVQERRNPSEASLDTFMNT